MTQFHVPRSYGPFESALQAGKASVRLRGAAKTPERTEFILAAFANANIAVGDYDRVIARWLTTWEPETVTVILDWVFRAFESGAVSGAEVFHLTASLNRAPTDEEIDALYEAGLSDSGISYGETSGEMDVSRVAYSREEAAATIAEQVAMVPGLEVTGITDTPDDVAEDPVISWVLYRPQSGSDVLEPAGLDGDVSPGLDAGELAVDKLVEHATGGWDRVVKVYGTRGQLAAWARWENGEAVAYRNGDAR